MKITELTKPLNKVMLRWNGQMKPAMVFSGQPARSWSTVLAFVLLEVPPSIVYAKADDVRPMPSDVELPPVGKAETVVQPPVDCLPTGVPYLVTLHDQENPQQRYLSFAFLYKGKPCWSTPVPLDKGEGVPAVKDRMLIPTCAEFVKAERL